uniref:Uncharacterized protein n=1 Tax=Anopheles albimanus TaxID=7167 RepID=A0A182FWW0_ANOAL
MCWLDLVLEEGVSGDGMME